MGLVYELLGMGTFLNLDLIFKPDFTQSGDAGAGAHEPMCLAQTSPGQLQQLRMAWKTNPTQKHFVLKCSCGWSSVTLETQTGALSFLIAESPVAP